MRKSVLFLMSLSPLVMNAQNNDPSGNLNEQFDKIILGDQKRKVEKATGIPPEAIMFQCSDPILKYTARMDFSNWYVKKLLESPVYTEASKIQFVKDALADTTRDEQGDAIDDFVSIPCNFWRTSKDATALIYACLDKQYETTEEKYKLFIYFHRLEFIINSQLPESYEMIADYIKRRPQFNYKWEGEPRLVHSLVKMGKEKEGLDFLEVIIDDLIHDRPIRPFFLSGNGVFQDGNIFERLCLSENDAVAKRATDLLFHLLSNKNFILNLNPLASYIDKERYDKMMDKWFAFYSSLDFSKVDQKELQANGWDAVKKAVPECGDYINFMMSANWSYLYKRYGKRYWEELLSKSIYTKKNRGRSFETTQLEYLEILFKYYPYTDKELQQMLLQAVITEDLLKPEYKESYLQLVGTAYPGGNVPKADFDKLQLGKLMPFSKPLKITAYIKKEVNKMSSAMPDEKINELIADLNSVAVKSNLPEIRLNKLSKFLISRNNPTNVINDFFYINNLVLEFHRYFDKDILTDYVDLFRFKFLPVVNAHHYNDFSIAQVTKQNDNGLNNYNLFVKFNKSIYELTYSERNLPYISDAQRLVKMLNLCLMDNKEKKRFIGMYGKVTYRFILAEPAAITPLAKKYNLGIYTMEEMEGAPKKTGW